MPRETSGRTPRADRQVPIWLKIFGSFSLLLLLAVAVLCAFNTRLLRQTVRPSLTQSKQTAIEQVAQRMDDYFQSMLFVLNKHAASSALQANVYRALHATNAYAQNRYAAGIRTLMFQYSESTYTQQGLSSILHCDRLSCASWETSSPKTWAIIGGDAYAEVWADTQSAQAKWFFNLSDPQSPYLEEQMLCVSKPLFNLYTGDYYAGAMVLGRMSELRGCYEGTLLEGERLLLLGEDGTLIHAGGAGDGDGFARAAEALAGLGAGSVCALDGQRYFISETVSRLTGWRLVSLAPEKVVFGGLLDLEWMLFVMLLLFAALSILASLYMARRITRPLKQLTRDMREVSMGRLETDIRVCSNDETQELAQACRQMLSEIRRLIAQQRARERERRQLETQFLQSQIKPHFINNSLRMLKLLMQLKEWDTARQALNAFSSVLGSTALSSRETVSLAEEVETVSNYLRLQQIGDMNHFTYEIRVEPAAAGFPVPRLLLQPLAENCVQHGYNRTQDGFRVMIEAITAQTGVIVRVSDTGTGMSRERLAQVLEETYTRPDDAHGLGMRNVRRRMQLYYRDSRFWLHSNAGEGTAVTLYLAGMTQDEPAREEGDGA